MIRKMLSSVGKISNFGGRTALSLFVYYYFDV